MATKVKNTEKPKLDCLKRYTSLSGRLRNVLAVLCIFSATQASALDVAMSTKVLGGNKPVIVGTTNLPDGIELMITLQRKESNYMAQDKANVSGGSFQVGPFSQNGASLNPGTYTLEVSMPLANFQPPPTWPVIGKDGAKLQGPLAKNSMFGGKVVEYRTSFNVGGGASAEKDNAARALVDKDKHEWWLNSCKYSCDTTQNLANKQGAPRNWNLCYNKCVANEPNRK